MWLLGAVPLVLFLSRINLIHFEHLKNGIRTKAVVTALEPGNHQAVRYSFVVAGRNYSGVGRAGFGNPEFGQLYLGEDLIISYAASNPDESCLGIPEELINNEITSIGLAALGFPIFAIAVNAFRFPQFRRWILA